MARADLKYIIGFETNDAPVVQATKRLRQLQGQQKELDRALKDGLISQNIFRKGQKQLNAEIQGLRTATAQGGKALDQYINKLDKGGKAMRRKELAAQQAGYQLQDFIVQIQAGQNPVIAFTQQFSQLAGFFAGPWGAAIGLGVAVLGGLVTALYGAKGEAESTETKILSLKDAIKALREETVSTSDEVALMFSGLTKGAFDAKRSLEKALLELSNATSGRVNATNFMDINVGQRTPFRDEIMAARKLQNEFNTLQAVERGRIRVKRELAEEQRELDNLASDSLQVIEDLRAADERARKKAQQDREATEKWLAAQNEALRLGNMTVGLEGRALLVAKQKVEQQKLFAELHKRGLDATKGEGLALFNNLLKQQQGVRYAYDANEAKKKALELAKKQVEETKKLTDQEKMINSLAENIGSSMEDAFMSMVEGTSSVKDAFKDMAQQIISQLYRVLVVQQMVGNFSTGGGGILGALAPIFGRASGGTIMANQPYIVGEKGPELIVPQNRGHVMNADLTSKAVEGGGEQVVVNQTINISTGVQQTVRNEIQSMMPQIAAQSKSAVLDAKRRGGSYGGKF